MIYNSSQKINTECQNSLRFADDVVLIVDHFDDAYQMLEELIHLTH